RFWLLRTYSLPILRDSSPHRSRLLSNNLLLHLQLLASRLQPPASRLQLLNCPPTSASSSSIPDTAAKMPERAAPAAWRKETWCSPLLTPSAPNLNSRGSESSSHAAETKIPPLTIAPRWPTLIATHFSSLCTCHLRDSSDLREPIILRQRIPGLPQLRHLYAG